MTTYGIINETIDAAVSADTETTIMDEKIPEGLSGTIKKILVSYGNVVDAKAFGGKLEMRMSLHSGPFFFPLGAGVGMATSGGFGNALEIEVNIPCTGNERIRLLITLAEAAVDCHAGIVWVA